MSSLIPVSKTVPYRLITSGNALKAALRPLETAQILGLDCETTGLDPHTHTIRLVQIAVPSQPVLLIDLSTIAWDDSPPTATPPVWGSSQTFP